MVKVTPDVHSGTENKYTMFGIQRNYPLLFLILQYIVCPASSTVTVIVTLKEFSYFGGNHCDNIFGSFKCDPFFKVCVETPRQRCRWTQTTSVSNKDHVSDILHTTDIHPNPIAFSLDTWKTPANIHVQIWNDNPFNDHLLEDLVWNYAGSPNVSLNDVRLAGKKASVNISLSIQCGVHYYGPDCLTHCKSGIHGVCSRNGTLTCNQGYTGKQCQNRITTRPIPTSSSSSSGNTMSRSPSVETMQHVTQTTHDGNTRRAKTTKATKQNDKMSTRSTKYTTVIMTREPSTYRSSSTLSKHVTTTSPFSSADTTATALSKLSTITLPSNSPVTVQKTSVLPNKPPSGKASTSTVKPSENKTTDSGLKTNTNTNHFTTGFTTQRMNTGHSRETNTQHTMTPVSNSSSPPSSRQTPITSVLTTLKQKHKTKDKPTESTQTTSRSSENFSESPMTSSTSGKSPATNHTTSATSFQNQTTDVGSTLSSSYRTSSQSPISTSLVHVSSGSSISPKTTTYINSSSLIPKSSPSSSSLSPHTKSHSASTFISVLTTKGTTGMPNVTTKGDINTSGTSQTTLSHQTSVGKKNTSHQVFTTKSRMLSSSTFTTVVSEVPTSFSITPATSSSTKTTTSNKLTTNTAETSSPPKASSVASSQTAKTSDQTKSSSKGRQSITSPTVSSNMTHFPTKPIHTTRQNSSTSSPRQTSESRPSSPASEPSPSSQSSESKPPHTSSLSVFTSTIPSESQTTQGENFGSTPDHSASQNQSPIVPQETTTFINSGGHDATKETGSTNNNVFSTVTTKTTTPEPNHHHHSPSVSKNIPLLQTTKMSTVNHGNGGHTVMTSVTADPVTVGHPEGRKQAVKQSWIQSNGAIVGGVLGGVAVCVLCVIIVIFVRSRRRKPACRDEYQDYIDDANTAINGRLQLDYRECDTAHSIKQADPDFTPATNPLYGTLEDSRA